MSYTALYRKFRPAAFEDVKGQDHIVTTLKNQIASGRVGHAYLFCGTRGTGKTTIAKILARSVNCENPQDGSPCGECASCKSIAAGNNMNVIEIDAASNNGVENVRSIIEEVSYSPVDSKYKVYIIDEVHMLSGGAFNALLKTLEEPPAYVIFILATTEVHKIPITVLSRCQRYDFKRISIDTIADRMRELLEIENAPVEERALRYIAKVADGSMRDALSLLDQCLAFHYGKELTYDMALDVLGAVDTGVFSELLRYIIDDDIISAVNLLEKIVMQGRELTQFVTDFTWYLRNLMLLMSSEDSAVTEALDMSTEHIARLREEAEMLELTTVFRYISVFSELASALKFSSQKRILVEMTIIKLCRPQMQVTDEALLDRVRALEEKLESGNFSMPMQINAATNTSQPQASTSVKKSLPVALPEEIKQIGSNWPAIVATMESPLSMYIQHSKLSVSEDGNTLFICVDSDIKLKMLSEEERKMEISDAIAEYTGKIVNFEIKCFSREVNFDNQYGDLINGLGMMIHEEFDEEE